VATNVRAPRKLDSEKAQRIVAAMHASVGRRGAAGSTFDQVAQEAGVSRGLLHYYFGSKEALLVEVVRRDCELRIESLEHDLAEAHSLDEIVAALRTSLEAFVNEEPGAQALVYEMLSASRHSEDLRVEMAELYRKWRDALARVLSEKEGSGEVRLRGEPEAVASVLFALGDGLELQLNSDPGWNSEPALEVAIRTARFLLGADA
jgi:AcrR family transcriptional regulator